MVAADVTRLAEQSDRDVITTARLHLRVPRHDDAKAIAQLANDRRIAENTARLPHPFRLADAKGFIAALEGGGEIARLVTLINGTPIGMVGLAFPPGQAPDLGYWLGVPFWGRGYATEAARAMVSYGFARFDVPALQACARVTNAASRRVLEKCGFQWTRVSLSRLQSLQGHVAIDRFQLARSDAGAVRSLIAPARLSLCAPSP